MLRKRREYSVPFTRPQAFSPSACLQKTQQRKGSFNPSRAQIMDRSTLTFTRNGLMIRNMGNSSKYSDFLLMYDSQPIVFLRVINCPTWLKGAGEQGNSRHKPRSRYQTTIAVLMHPFSRGSVHITSGDPFSHPAIDPGYLNDPGISLFFCYCKMQ